MADLKEMMPRVAEKIWGPRNLSLSNGKLWRWGNHGSKTVDLDKGIWFDHERNIGGGVFKLVSVERGHMGSGIHGWLIENGFLEKSFNQEKILNTYGYYDLKGVLRYQQVRRAPKNFFTRRPDGNGGWIWNLVGVELILYRLTEVTQAIQEGKTIYVVEGEKDADRLWSIGLAATTNIGGAGKWRDIYTETLRSADVVILPDNDDAGYHHAKIVGKHLKPVAKSLKVLKLADFAPLEHKDDVSDWLDKGGNATTLEILVENVDLYQPSVEVDPPDWKKDDIEQAFEEIQDKSVKKLEFVAPRTWLQFAVPTVEWLAHNRIPRGRVTLMNGHGGIGKTTICLQLIIATVMGSDWIGTVIDAPGRAMYFTAEEDERGMHRHLAQVTASLGQRHEIFEEITQKGASFACMLGHSSVLSVADKRSDVLGPTPLFLQLRERVLDEKPTLVVIEAAANVFAGNEISRSHVMQFVGMLSDLAVSSGAAIVLQQHPSLAGLNTGTGISGSTHWHNAVRARLNFRAIPEEPNVDADEAGPEKTTSQLRELIVAKSNYGPSDERVLLQWDAGRYVIAHKADKKKETQRIKDCFLYCLRRANNNAQPVGVSVQAKHMYYGTMFETMQEARAGGITRKMFESVMQPLVNDGLIELRPCMLNNREYTRIFIKGFDER